tara:strand:+ start:1332 stop:3065 length:1734 start_codon:yes stop_codon:yes gene_type:complete
MNKIDLLKRIFRTQIKKYFKQILIIFLFIILSAMATTAVAWLLDPAIKKIFIEKDKVMLYTIPIAIVCAFAVKSLSVFVVRIKTIKIAYSVIKNIQILLGEKILQSDTSFLTSKHSGKFISNFTNDTLTLSNVLNGIAVNAVKEGVTLIFLLGLMFYQNWKLSLLAITLIPIAALFSRKIGKRMGKAVTTFLTISEVFTKYLSEILKATQVIKIFQKEKDELKNLSNVISSRTDTIVKMERTRLGAGPIMETITGIAIAIVVFTGGLQSIAGQIEIGQFFSFLTALMLAYQPVRALASVNIGIQEGLTAAERIYKLLDNKDFITNKEGSKEFQITNADVKLKNLSFKYSDGTQALKNINATINGGTKVALVGPSGGGKSTFINLIPRFYDPQEGCVEIDSQNIKDVTIQSLRRHIAMVSQDVVLFDDTVKANIAYGNIEASDKEILEASKLANCHEFIEDLQNKYETLIGENGVKLSGGQKQRISIARAILKKSSIILLDEATSSLDTESEKKVQDAINNLTQSKTTIIIAHRLSTINKVDKILVIKDGELIEEGSHRSLIDNSIMYKKLYEQQQLL